MIQNYLKIAWRNLFSNSYILINTAGLAVGITACLLIGLFVYNETSFDQGIPNRAQLYRLNEYVHYNGTTPQLSAAIGPPIAPFLKDNHSEIESFARVLPATPFIYPSITLEYNGRKIRPGAIACTDTSFASLFGVNITEGDKGNFIRDQHSIVLTQSLAYKLFGNTPALHKALMLKVDDTTAYPVTVCNVIKDLPGTAHLQFEGLLPIPEGFFSKGSLGTNYGVMFGPSYVRLSPNTNITALQEKLTTTLHTKNKFIDARLQPVNDIHTRSTDINYDYFNYDKIDGKYIKIFIIIALAIFIIACCNFINLTIATAAYRGKEISVKKIMGASRSQIVVQVLTETGLSVLVAILLSIVLAVTCLPWLNTVLDRQLAVDNLYRGPMIGIYAAVLVVTTLLAGLYPALLISSSRIRQALQTKVLFGGSRTYLRNVLVTGQFAIAVIFIVSLIVFLKQLQFMENKDLGYAYTQVLKVPMDMSNSSKTDILRSELAKTPGVIGVTYGFMELGGDGSLFGIDYTAPDGISQHVSVDVENAGPDYIRLFDMKLAAGRDFSKTHPVNEYLINETLARQIGYKDPVGKPISISSFPPGNIVGVVKDFNYSSLHTKIAPLLIASLDYIPFWKKQLYVKVSTAGLSGTLQDIGATLKKVCGDDTPEIQFLDQHFKEVYKSEKEAETMIAIIGGLAIIIASIGLLSLAAFIIVKKTKEIGIRKVLGASVAGVAGNLSKEFIRLVLIAFIIAAPIAGWLTHNWLQDFAYQIEIRWWMFALAGIVAIGVALLTVGFLAIRAARANPVKSLRTE